MEKVLENVEIAEAATGANPVEIAEAAAPSNDVVTPEWSTAERIAWIMRHGGVKHNLVVKGVTTTKDNGRCIIALNVDKPIPAYLQVNGVWQDTTSTLMYSSNIEVNAVIRNNADAAFAVNYLNDHSKAYETLLSGAKITIITQLIASGEDYINPFTTRRDAEPIQFKHNVYVTYFTDVTFSRIGNKTLDKIFDKMLDEKEEEMDF